MPSAVPGAFARDHTGRIVFESQQAGVAVHVLNHVVDVYAP